MKETRLDTNPSTYTYLFTSLQAYLCHLTALVSEVGGGKIWRGRGDGEERVALETIITVFTKSESNYVTNTVFFNTTIMLVKTNTGVGQGLSQPSERKSSKLSALIIIVSQTNSTELVNNIFFLTAW